MKRSAKTERKTSETNVRVSLSIDGTGNYIIDTTIPFFDHMLSLMAQHGLFDLTVKAQGDTEIDYHHTVEDVGICLGESLVKALGNKKGIRRYGSARTPMMEAIASVDLDICGRPYLSYNVAVPSSKTGNFDIELIEEFFRAFTNCSGTTMHIDASRGTNAHHIIEAVFKSAGKALDMATSIDLRIKDVLSTKGKL